MSASTTTHALVAGGAGFIGSHLCERLLDSGRRVTCIDNLSSGMMENLSHLLGHPRFGFVEHDIVRPIRIEADEIFNLACPASPVFYRRDPVSTLKTCVEGTMNLLDLALESGATLLLASTSEVYGDPAVSPQPEDYRGSVSPVGERSCYAEGKRCAEALCAAYHRRHGIVVKIARIFNTYGPRMRPDDGRVVATFVAQALGGRAMTIHGDGAQTRSFCYVDDTVTGLLKLMETRDEIIGPLNLGSPVEIPIRELASLVARESGSQSAFAYVPRPDDDPESRRPDISMAKKLLGWEPTVFLEEGIRRTIAHHRSSRDEPGRRSLVGGARSSVVGGS